MSNKQVMPTASETSETAAGILDAFLRFLLLVGALTLLGSVALLLVTFFNFASGSLEGAEQAARNIDLFRKVLVGGVLLTVLATTWLFWGEETLGVLQLIGAALLYFAPLYVPPLAGKTTTSEIALSALQAMQLAGMFAGILGALVTTTDVLIRVKLRAREGSKADQMKYGKGVKEEREIRNVFMGKCWQLPYCRKFVREQCPIYHSRRTCWKERVGCMCEETVIRNAMEGVRIPKDALTAAKYIPYNKKLTPGQKAARCRSCVIYNEHQRHKYKMAVPASLLTIAVIYIFAKGPLMNMLGSAILSADRMVGVAVYRPDAKGGMAQVEPETMMWFKEILLVCLLLVVFAYLMRLVEFLVFKAKV